MEFSKLLEERRSIRKFDPEKKVTADQIKDSGSILEEFADDTVLCRCYAGKNRGFFRCMPAGV